MSEEAPTGLNVMEKLLGIIVAIIGAIVVERTYNTPPGGAVAPFSNFFMATGFILIAIGLFLFIAKSKR